MSQPTCLCGAHRLHRVWEYLWDHPAARRVDAARALHLSPGNVREAIYELRRRDPGRLCPACFKPEVYQGVCHACGVERDAPNVPLEVRGDYQSPTNHLHAGNLLGSVTDYDSLGFSNSGLVMRRRMERGVEDGLVVGVKSDVMNWLKDRYPDELVTDEAGRLAIKEVAEFRSRYPSLALSKNLRRQLAENVMERMRMLHPQLRHVTPLVGAQT